MMLKIAEPLSKRPWNQTACTRIWPDGRVMVYFRHAEAVDIWRDVSRRHYPECALMVGDEVVQYSAAHPDLEAVSAALKGRKPWAEKEPRL